jgi:hypothetical protein
LIFGLKLYGATNRKMIAGINVTYASALAADSLKPGAAACGGAV